MILEVLSDLKNRNDIVLSNDRNQSKVVSAVAVEAIHSTASPSKKIKRPFEDNERVSQPLKKQKNNFEIIKIPKTRARGYIPLLEEWTTLACEYEETICLPLRQRVRDALDILHRILEDIKNINNDESDEEESWDCMLLCGDEDVIQAIACVEIENNFLSFLVTHPDNLQDNRYDGGMIPLARPPVRRASTQIILYLAQHALKTGYTIKLSAFSGAVEFYKKLQFTIVRSSVHNLGSSEMELSVKKIQDLVSRKIAPFHTLSIEE